MLNSGTPFSSSEFNCANHLYLSHPANLKDGLKLFAVARVIHSLRSPSALMSHLPVPPLKCREHPLSERAKRRLVQSGLCPLRPYHQHFNQIIPHTRCPRGLFWGEEQFVSLRASRGLHREQSCLLLWQRKCWG